MKYDPALVLKLVSFVEAKSTSGSISVDEISMSDVTRDDLSEHLKLLIEEGLILGAWQNADNALFDVLITRLTIKGHQFLAVSRDRTRWKKFIKLAQAGVGFVTKEGFQIALEQILKGFLR